MFRRYDNLKRAIALLGVVVTLSSGTQQTHFLCDLAGCVIPGSVRVEGVAPCCKQEGSSVGRCSHSQRSTSQVAGSQDRCAEENEGSCPCPPSCWCHQTPAPMNLPKDTSELPLLVLTGIENLGATAVETIDGSQPPQVVSTIALESSSLSASQRCVQLCRFLT